MCHDDFSAGCGPGSGAFLSVIWGLFISFSASPIDPGWLVDEDVRLFLA
ncbi:hypothetical protein RRSWK_01097 [Rhodopirellula sp. SWK7]|nr:hypothetical protein RRSWK_01097 [Rhodopirellula sp. SWK7]